MHEPDICCLSANAATAPLRQFSFTTRLRRYRLYVALLVASASFGHESQMFANGFVVPISLSTPKMPGYTRSDRRCGGSCGGAVAVGKYYRVKTGGLVQIHQARQHCGRIPDLRRTYNSAESKSALFGIRGFRKWFETQFPDAITPIPNARKLLRDNSRRVRNGQYPMQSLATETNPDKISAAICRELEDAGANGGGWRREENRADHDENSHDGFETFDHVLIDMNQMLHTTLRRARSEGHALTLVLKELDHCITMARPRKSIVLAMDGPPSAAKIATQRTRRYRTVMRSKWKKRRKAALERLLRKRGGGSGTRSEESFKSSRSHIGIATHRVRKKNLKRSSMRDDEVAALCITPGTDFMERAKDAVLFWAWQRLTNPQSALSRRVKVYVSPSDCPGEGEVKILDWIYLNSPFGFGGSGGGRMRVKPGDSVAVWGGDSDLVLECLVLPPQITHNVFIIIPDRSENYCISLWEVTRALSRFLPQLDLRQIVRLRTDLSLLLILNGNDYLPKLRGSSGFDKLFHTYLRLVKDHLVSTGGGNWGKKKHHRREVRKMTEMAKLDTKNASGKAKKEQHVEHKKPLSNSFFLLDEFNAGFQPWNGTDMGQASDYLDSDGNVVNGTVIRLNLPFALEFFSQLADKAPPTLISQSDMLPYANSITPLSNLHRMMDGGWMPSPATWEVLPQGCGNSDGHETVRLTLGVVDGGRLSRSGSGTSTHVFEVDHRARTNVQGAKHRLAAIALEELLGWTGSVDAHGQGYEDDCPGEISSVEDVVEDVRADSFVDASFPWEVQRPVEADVEQYLAGLLWNVQTYRDGVCPDYAYNYGRRLSPTAMEVRDYIRRKLEEVKQDNGNSMATLSLLDLFDPCNRTDPLNAGLSCLAALPVQARHFVPHPYRLLTEDGAVDDIYAECMSNETNLFHMDKFRRLSLVAMREKQKRRQGNDGLSVGAHEVDEDDGKKTKGRGAAGKQNAPRNYDRPIRTSSKHWTVLSWGRHDLDHPFAPPEPFSDRLSALRRSKRIRVSRMQASHEPIWAKRPRLDVVHERISLAQYHQRKSRGDPQGEICRGQNLYLGTGRQRYFSHLYPSDNSNPIQSIRYMSAYSCNNTKTLEGYFDRTHHKEKDEILFFDSSEKDGTEGSTSNASFESTKVHFTRSAEAVVDDSYSNASLVVGNEGEEREIIDEGLSLALQYKMQNNVQNFSALMCLNALTTDTALHPKIYQEWETTSLSKDVESTKLFLANGKNKSVFRVTRGLNVAGATRQGARQELASRALSKIVGKDWANLTVQEIKCRIMGENMTNEESGDLDSVVLAGPITPDIFRPEKNIQNRTSIECLYCLADAGLVFSCGKYDEDGGARGGSAIDWEMVTISSGSGAELTESIGLDLCIAVAGTGTDGEKKGKTRWRRTFTVQRANIVGRWSNRKVLKHQLSAQVLREIIGSDWKVLTIHAMRERISRETFLL